LPRGFLRGMNLGGRRITNGELCAGFEAMGFGEVAAFLAIGNVVFASDEEDESALRSTIESGLEERAALGDADGDQDEEVDDDRPEVDHARAPFAHRPAPPRRLRALPGLRTSSLGSAMP
jgi:hypothetical protein